MAQIYLLPHQKFLVETELLHFNMKFPDKSDNVCLSTPTVINRYLTLSFPALIRRHWYFDNVPVISYTSPLATRIRGEVFEKIPS